MIDQLRGLHDASKHRRTVSVGGLVRDDPPVGFDPTAIVGLPPMAEIILKHDPKLPAVARVPKPVEKGELLEEIAPLFVQLVDSTGVVALSDARQRVPLKETQFRSSGYDPAPAPGAA